jgi:hypothetical protein
MTIAELQQNVSTQYTLFNWELSFEAQSGKSLPVKLEIVSYNASRTPSNGATILTLSTNSSGFDLLGTDIAGSEQGAHCPAWPSLLAWSLAHTLPPAPAVFNLSALNAGRISAGLEPAAVCDPNYACVPGPGTLLRWASDM